MTIEELNKMIMRHRKDTDMTADSLLRFVNEIEATVYREVISRYYIGHPRRDCHICRDDPLDIGVGICAGCKGRLPPPWKPYTAEDFNRELLVPLPYDVLYQRYVDFRLSELSANGNAANDEARFRESYYEFAQWYAEHHYPIGRGNMRMEGYSL